VEHVAQLRDHRDRFEEAGVGVVLIGLGRPDQAGWFCAEHELPFACVVQPDLSAHRAFGVRRGTLAQVAGPANWGRWMKNQLTGKRQTAVAGMGDGLQLAGTFVVDAHGVVRYSHRGQRSSDIAPIDEVLEAVAALAPNRGVG
jgi:peroxiredoxin